MCVHVSTSFYHILQTCVHTYNCIHRNEEAMGREKYIDIGTDSGADTDIHPHTIIPVTGCQTAKQEFGTL